MESESLSGVGSPRFISSMPDRCRASVAARWGHFEVTTDIDLDSLKYEGSFIFGSAYIH